MLRNDVELDTPGELPRFNRGWSLGFALYDLEFELLLRFVLFALLLLLFLALALNDFNFAVKVFCVDLLK